MATHSVSGLCWLQHGSSSLYQQVPLQNVHVDATLYDLCAEVKVQQTYVNNLHTEYGLSHASSPLECVYIFPLDEESAVFSFVAELDGVVVEGRIREKMEARAEYDTAVAMNRSAMLLEQSSDNIFQMKVGNLKPGSVCTITLTYLTLLAQQGRHNRLTLPMIIAPKYMPSDCGPTPPFLSLEQAPLNTIHEGYHCHHCLCSPIIGTRHHCDTCTYDLCHGCHMQHDMSHHMLSFTGPSYNPPTLPSTPSHTTIESKLTNLTIKLTITMPSPIVSIQCPSHPNETKITHNKDLSSHASAFFHSTVSCSLSKDFILLVEQQRCFDPRVLCELDMTNNTAAVSLAFIPPPVDMLSASQIQCELIFLIDCSGSMHGSSITCVRECMQLLLRSLPVHSRFNIITFGSRWSSLFPSSRAYDDTSLSAASLFISRLQANLGGTEIYPPLVHVLTSDILPTHPRQVFLLTDGQVSNVEQLVQLTSQHAVTTRLFTFGIGDSVDRLLCKKLAQAGRGKCEFVTAEDGGGAGMREKVVRQVARAMQPVLTDVRVDWGQLKGPLHEVNNAKGVAISVPPSSGSSGPSASFLQCPSIAPAIFMSSRYILHALNVSLPDFVWQQAKGGKNVEFKCEITITARSNHPHEKEPMHHSVVLMGEQITQACVIHTLAAKERIRELENQVPNSSGEVKKRLEDEILQLAMKHTLSSGRTSFVAVYNAGTDKERFEETSLVCNPPRSLLSLKSMKCDVHSVSSGCKLLGTYSSAVMRCKSACSSPAPRRSLLATAVQSVSSGGKLLGTFSKKHSAKCVAECAPFASVQPTSASVPFGNVQKQGATFGSAFSEDFLSSNQSDTDTSVSFGSEPEGNVGGFFGSAPTGTNTNPFIGAPLISKTSLQAVAGASALFGSWGCQSDVPQAPWKDAKATAFEDLIQLQSAKGMWQITPMLINIVHVIIPSSFLTITMQSLQDVSKEQGVDDAVVGVIVALQLLETHYKHRHAEWEMLATKARFFLNEDEKISTKLQQDIKYRIANLLGN